MSHGSRGCLPEPLRSYGVTYFVGVKLKRELLACVCGDTPETLALCRLHSPHSVATRRSLGFIDRLVIGPTANKSLSLDAVSSFFKKKELHVEVVSSTIPYRDW
jgi:hypothetical protein